MRHSQIQDNKSILHLSQRKDKHHHLQTPKIRNQDLNKHLHLNNLDDPQMYICSDILIELKLMHIEALDANASQKLEEMLEKGTSELALVY
jgi:hypothetical protein